MTGFFFYVFGLVFCFTLNTGLKLRLRTSRIIKVGMLSVWCKLQKRKESLPYFKYQASMAQTVRLSMSQSTNHFIILMGLCTQLMHFIYCFGCIKEITPVLVIFKTHPLVTPTYQVGKYFENHNYCIPASQFKSPEPSLN